MARFALGLGESGNFPASIKTIAEWFPKKERALATGLFNSGTNIGAIVTPLIVPWITYRFGWQMAFIGTGALGLTLGDRVVDALSRSRSGPPCIAGGVGVYPQRSTGRGTSKVPLTRCCGPSASMGHSGWALLHRSHLVHLLVLGAGFSQPPLRSRPARHGCAPVRDLHRRNRGQHQRRLAFILASAHGWTLNASRKTALLVCALAVAPVVFAAPTSNLWVAVGTGGDRCRRTSRMVGEYVHSGLRHVPANSRRERGGIRQHGGIRWRHVRRQSRGLHPAMDWIVRVGLYDCGIGLPSSPLCWCSCWRQRSGRSQSQRLLNRY